MSYRLAVLRASCDRVALRARVAALSELADAAALGLAVGLAEDLERVALVARDEGSEDWASALGGLSLAEGIARYEAAVAALAQLHARGYAHGALSPWTLRVLGDGRVAVCFAGVSGLLRPANEALDSWRAPESYLGEGTPVSRDVFALGAAGYALVSGERLGAGLGLRGWRQAALGSSAWPGEAALRWPGVSAEWSAVVARALGRPQERYSNAVVLKACLGTSGGALQPAEPVGAWDGASASEGAVGGLSAQQLPAQGRVPSKKALRWTLRWALLAAVLVIGAAAVSRGLQRGPAKVDRTCDRAEDCGAEMLCLGGLCEVPGFVYLPPARLRVGAREGEVSTPVEVEFEAEITRGFFVSAHEVSQQEWAAMSGGTPSWFSGCGLECPVESVSWYEALEFANRRSAAAGLEPCYVLSECTGEFGAGCPALVAGDPAHHCEGGFVCEGVEFKGLACEGYRLPTEIEWEYAARGATRSAHYGGEMQLRAETFEAEFEALSLIAVTALNSEVEYEPAWPCVTRDAPEEQPCGPAVRGTRAPNAYGLYDMIGNVGEWTYDAWKANPVALPSAQCPNAPIGPSGEPHCEVEDVRDHFVEAPVGVRSVRGGNWFHGPGFARAPARSGAAAGTRWIDIGFRLVRTFVEK